MADVPPPREQEIISEGLGEPDIIHAMYCLPCMCYDMRRPAVTVLNGMAQCEGHMKAFVNTRKNWKSPTSYDFIYKLPEDA